MGGQRGALAGFGEGCFAHLMCLCGCGPRNVAWTLGQFGRSSWILSVVMMRQLSGCRTAIMDRRKPAFACARPRRRACRVGLMGGRRMCGGALSAHCNCSVEKYRLQGVPLLVSQTRIALRHPHRRPFIDKCLEHTLLVVSMLLASPRSHQPIGAMVAARVLLRKASVWKQPILTASVDIHTASDHLGACASDWEHSDNAPASASSAVLRELARQQGLSLTQRWGASCSACAASKEGASQGQPGTPRHEELRRERRHVSSRRGMGWPCKSRELPD